MSCFSLPKKLKQLPSSSKKFWTSSLSPKLRRLRHRTLNLSKSLSKTATHLLDLRHKRHHSIPRPPLRGGGHFYNYKQQYHHQYYQHLEPYSSGSNTPSTVYVDRLFGEASTSKEGKVGVAMEASSGGCSSESGGEGGGDGGGEKKRKKVGSKWKEYVSSMPKIKGVDERAEEFISKFRQQMSLQREQSIVEFQEMLARSA